MPVPRDRESLLSVAAELERAVDQPRETRTKDEALKHAHDLFRLGEVRFRLDEMSEAERRLGESASAFSKIDGQVGRDWVAVVRLMQARVPMAEGRFDDALAIVESAVSTNGFPRDERLKDARNELADTWLLLLAQHNDDERLYVAAGVALDQLDANGPEKEQLVVARASGRRGDAARGLGRGEEAVELYEHAVSHFKAAGAELSGKELIETAAKLTAAQTELERLGDSLAALGQMAATSATTLPKLALGRLRRRNSKSGD